MSWSRSFTGTRATILAALASVAAEVKATDESYGASADVVALHQNQVEKTTDAVTKFVEAAPEDYAFSATLSGHGHADTTGVVQSDSWSVSLGAHKPAPVAAAAGS